MKYNDVNHQDFKAPIVRMGVRILRPKEYEAMIHVIKKPHHKTMFQALLYTGMRYIEAQRFQNYPSWFDGDFVHLPHLLAERKTMRTQPERWVRLNNQGKMAVDYFTRLKEELPAYQGWNMNLKRWAEDAGISVEGMSCKTTRKTWESWLMFYFPHHMAEVTLSQGHDTVTSIQHYLNMPFTESDRLEIKNFVEGWTTDDRR